MPLDPIQLNSRFLDLSGRVSHSEAVVASPAAAAETIIASVTLTSGLTIVSGVLLIGWAAFTVGTDGVSAQLRVRQTTVAGTLKVDSGAITEVAANKDEAGIVGFDSAPSDGQIYKLTMQVTLGSAVSTVSAVSLVAIPV